MPIRSPRGRAAAYRALWQWPLRSPARLAVAGVVFVALGIGLSVGITAARGGNDAGAPAAASPTTSARATGASSTPGTYASATPTALPPVRELTPTTLPVSQAPAAAMQVAATWTAAWVRPPDTTTPQQWLDGLRPTTTDEYLGVLSGVDPQNIPATRVTGAPEAVQVSPRSVQVKVPTDALVLLVTVVDTDAGWRVSDYDRG
jgi:hypothetical protein